MIKSFEVKNLNDIITDKFYFHHDINILTGKNGCGKTTILKLLWYMISGNYDKIFSEMTLSFAEVKFENGSLVSLTKVASDEAIDKVILKVGVKNNISFREEYPINKLEQTRKFAYKHGSIFFPTFRRFEGGFSIDSVDNKISRRYNSLRDALENISNILTTDQHKFITSISTNDIDNLLSQKYADILEKIRKLEDKQSKTILDAVANSTKKEKAALEEIKNLVKENESIKNEVMRPFSVLSGLINQIFKNKSIQISKNLELGEAKGAISSDKLSAGEKQMLSFLCYNFFFDNSIIFIDEPELSLHTDWQMLLFPILLRQGKKNQFIIATHSPFIYSKYPEKEIIVNQDKGNQNAK